VPANPVVVWNAPIGGRLSQPVCAHGRLFVAQIDAHTVHCLDGARGQLLWSFTAGGRVDSPPTLYRGLVLFGSRDGWVYCLRAADGVPVWRRLAAPQEVYAVAYEQVESLWPAHGSVLIHRDTAYVAAGRSSYLDGGIVLYGLDPETGDVRCVRRLTNEHAGALDPPSEVQRKEMEMKISQNNTDYKTFLAADRSDAFSMRGALTDVLTAEDESIYMRHMRFDAQLAQQEQKAPHLFSTSSLLDGSEHHRSYWALGTGDFSRTPVAYPWIVRKSLAVPYGLMLAYDKQTVWGVHRGAAKGHSQDYALFALPRPDASVPDNLLPDFAQRSGRKTPVDGSWTTQLAIRPRALLRAGATLIVGGESEDAVAENSELSSSSEHDSQGTLCFASADDGKVLRSVQLSSPPTWDGMAAADGRLYISMVNGAVICLEGD
jgi:outer membrane protein assembly factor BamB